MVQNKILVGVPTGEYARRADFYDYLGMLELPPNTMRIFSHDRSPAHSRNIIIDQAIEHNCTHVLFIDDDMAFKPNALKQLLEHDVDIISGLYFSRAYPHNPLVFDVADDSGACLPMYLFGNEPRLKEVVAADFGFCLIKTSIFEKLEKPYVRLGELNSEQWCDDIGFFNRVRKAGIKIYCDMECLIGHIGTMCIWPSQVNGKWYSLYDSGGKLTVPVPQIEEPIVMKV